MNRLQPKAVIFDLGSTLIEYEKMPWAELGRMCNDSGWEFLKARELDVPDAEAFDRVFEETKNEYRRVAEETQEEWDVPKVAADLFERMGLQVEDGLVAGFFEAYYQPVSKHIFIFDDCIETLQKIRKRYGTVGLVSNTVFPESAHRLELKRFGIEPFLDFAIFSSTFGLRKPHPDIFFKAANMAGVAPSECVYIGDRFKEDVEGPTAVSMDAILRVHPLREYPDQLPEWVRTITTLSELENHLDI